VSATWGARCRKPARRVLRGGMGTRSHAGSVRALSRKGQLRRGSAKATAPRPVPTSRSISHDWLIKFVEHRIADGRILRLIRKWLKAGVSEEGNWSKTEVGVPQGSVASPLLANIYLHYIFDLWARHWRTHRAAGDMIVVRYADDIVLGFEHRTDAERFLQEWKDRLHKFGLELHSGKTRLIEFGRFAIANRERRDAGKPETFNFLGFTHICGKTRRNGRFTVTRKTIRKRLTAKLRELKEELRRRWHEPRDEVGKWLRSVVQGYFNYHAVPGNTDSLNSFRTQVLWCWHRALQRRSQKGRMTWERFASSSVRWIPNPQVLHPYPDLRFDATHPR
jgi:RNA-directed DNA polymerase